MYALASKRETKKKPAPRHHRFSESCIRNTRRGFRGLTLGTYCMAKILPSGSSLSPEVSSLASSAPARHFLRLLARGPGRAQKAAICERVCSTPCSFKLYKNSSAGTSWVLFGALHPGKSTGFCSLASLALARHFLNLLERGNAQNATIRETVRLTLCSFWVFYVLSRGISEMILMYFIIQKPFLCARAFGDREAFYLQIHANPCRVYCCLK